MNEMDAWTTAVRAELGLEDDAQVRLVLLLAKEVARGVLRPAAPVTAYLAGLAVGRGADVEDVVERVRRLAAEHAATRPDA